MELYSRIMVKPRLKTFHTFGCPTFTLDSRLQNNQSVPKWHSRCRTGLYLGISPRHARSVSLVLHLETARISPQLHIQHDDLFETVYHNDNHQPWKVMASFLNETPRRRYKLQRPLAPTHASKPNDDYYFSFPDPAPPR